jgi:PAS domain S-box-containing protein
MPDRRRTTTGKEDDLSALRGRIAELEATAREHVQAREAFLEAEERYLDLYDNSPDMHFTVAEDGTVLSVNRFGADCLGYEPDELVGGPVWVVVHPEDLAGVQQQVAKIFRAGGVGASELEFRKVRKDGSMLWVQERVRVVSGVRGGPIELRIICRDITARRKAEAALRESEQRYRALFEDSRDAIYITATDGELVDFNQAACELFGYTAEEFERLNARELYARPQDRERFQTAVAGDGSVRDFEVKLRRKDGALIDCLLTSSERRGRDGQAVGYQGIIHDITERKRLEEEILAVSTREQRRIGQDLHDGLGQQLTGMAFLLTALERKLEARQLAEARDAKAVGLLAHGAIAQTRYLSRGLYPAALETAGLAGALEDLGANAEMLFDASCTVLGGEAAPIADRVIGGHVYHIAQEAVTNAVRHGKATHVTIELGRADAHTILTVSDDGTGIPEPLEEGKGMGLHIMRYRARMIGGSLQVGRGTERGTVVRCTFPTPRQESGGETP